jgi:hypothetical protein
VWQPMKQMLVRICTSHTVFFFTVLMFCVISDWSRFFGT